MITKTRPQGSAHNQVPICDGMSTPASAKHGGKHHSPDGCYHAARDAHAHQPFPDRPTGIQVSREHELRMQGVMLNTASLLHTEESVASNTTCGAANTP